MRASSAVGQLRALRAVVREAGRRHGAGPLWAARRARRLRARGGFEYPEALAAGLFDPAVPDATADEYVSEHRTAEVTSRLNPEALAALTGEKLVFYRWFTALGIPVPRLFGAVGRAGGWSALSGRPLPDAATTTSFLLHEVPDEVVVKPSGGHHGLGVRVLHRRDGVFVDLDARCYDPDELVADVLADPEFDVWVVQERLRDHADLSRFAAGSTLQTLRVTTFLEASGTVRVLHAGLKLATGGGNVDNYRGGTTGNSLVEVDVPTGVVGRVLGGPAPAGLEGLALPMWDEVRDLVVGAAAHLLPQRTMGWDVALTSRGPVIVEANRGYDPFPTPAFGGAMRAVRDALARESRTTAEATDP